MYALFAKKKVEGVQGYLRVEASKIKDFRAEVHIFSNLFKMVAKYSKRSCVLVIL